MSVYLLSWNGRILSPHGHCCPNWKSVLNRMETDRAPPAASSLRHVPRIIHDEVSLVSMCGRLVEAGRDRLTVYRCPAAACSIQREPGGGWRFVKSAVPDISFAKSGQAPPNQQRLNQQCCVNLGHCYFS